MSRSDRITEEVGWIKLVFGVFVVIDASLITWLAQHHASGKSVLLISGHLGTIALSGVMVWPNWKIYRLLAELEVL